MTRRLLALWALLAAAVIGLILLLPAGGNRSAPPPAATAPASGRAPISAPVTSAPAGAASSRPAPSAAAPTLPAPSTPPAYNPADFPIAAALNASGSTISRDLDILQQVFDAWRSNFPREGNPVGENADITAALLGENRLGLALVPKGHPALNARGELCDRWGTPFRFHQLSGERMEVRSAGPDRKFATEDDALWTPQ